VNWVRAVCVLAALALLCPNVAAASHGRSVSARASFDAGTQRH